MRNKGRSRRRKKRLLRSLRNNEGEQKGGKDRGGGGVKGRKFVLKIVFSFVVDANASLKSFKV